MKILLKISFIMILAFSFTSTSGAQEELYNKLNKKLAVLYKQGKTDEAIKVAEKALQVAKKTYGEKHPYVSASLNNMALLYIAEGKYDKAEELCEKSLKIAEEILGKDSPHLANILENMVKCNDKMGKREKVETLEARLDQIRE